MSFRGPLPYELALAEQLAARERVWAGGPEQILLCEHPSVITLGRFADRRHVVAAGDVPVIQTDRGGDATYHGPGQLMIYPIVRVKRVVGFLEAVATALAATCAAFGAAGAVFRRAPAGLWLGGAKLAACGIHIARGVSVHGWALNVAVPDAEWRRIVPCGLAVPQISLAAATGRTIAVADVAADLEPRLIAALV